LANIVSLGDFIYLLLIPENAMMVKRVYIPFSFFIAQKAKKTKSFSKYSTNSQFENHYLSSTNRHEIVVHFQQNRLWQICPTFSPFYRILPK
jgi:hypothetical protein